MANPFIPDPTPLPLEEIEECLKIEMLHVGGLVEKGLALPQSGWLTACMSTCWVCGTHPTTLERESLGWQI